MHLSVVHCDISKANKPYAKGLCFGSSIIQYFHGWLEGLDNEYKQHYVWRGYKQTEKQHLNSTLSEENEQTQLCMNKITQSKIIHKPQEKLATKIRKKETNCLLYYSRRYLIACRTPG